MAEEFISLYPSENFVDKFELVNIHHTDTVLLRSRKNISHLLHKPDCIIRSCQRVIVGKLN